MSGWVTPTALRVTEKAWQAQVVALAKTLGWRVYHGWISIRSEPGWPDLVLVRERVIYAELKAEGKQPNPHQVLWLQALTVAGQEVYVWTPAQAQDVADVLQRHERPLPAPTRAPERVE